MLEPVPQQLAAPQGALRFGRWSGRLPVDPVPLGPRRGRVRRWRYSAAGDERVTVGAAIVDLGVVAVAFAFASLDGQTTTWETRRPLRRGARVGPLASDGAALTGRSGQVHIGGDSGLALRVPTEAGVLRAEFEVVTPVTPISLATATAAGGWNATEKAAGFGVRGEVQVGAAPAVALDPSAGGWSDWASGRQDRRTTWRWAAGSGTTADGRRVGFNTSTGMNELGPGEDVVWWEGVPAPLEVSTLEPVGDDAAGAWRVAGPGWALDFAPQGVRAEQANLLLLASDYTQPIGRFEGTLPDRDGRPTRVSLAGVTEDHLAVW